MDDLCLAPIPVTFEPHWADERMLWLTAGSIFVSAILGGLAYWNGHTAMKIAREAAEREEARIERADRAEVAFSILRFIATIQERGDIHGFFAAKMGDNTVAAARSFLDTKATVDCYFDESTYNVRTWFKDFISDLSTTVDAEREQNETPSNMSSSQLISKARGQLANWAKYTEYELTRTASPKASRVVETK